MKKEPCFRGGSRSLCCLSIALLLFSSPQSALAGGPIAICQSGQPFLWPNGGIGIRFNPDQGGLGPLNNAQAVAEVQTAFGVWQAVPTAKASFVNAGPLSINVDISNFAEFLFPLAPDGLNAIVFDETEKFLTCSSGLIRESWVFAGPEWIDPRPVKSSKARRF